MLVVLKDGWAVNPFWVEYVEKDEDNPDKKTSVGLRSGTKWSNIQTFIVDLPFNEVITLLNKKDVEK